MHIKSGADDFDMLGCRRYFADIVCTHRIKDCVGSSSVFLFPAGVALKLIHTEEAAEDSEWLRQVAIYYHNIVINGDVEFQPLPYNHFPMSRKLQYHIVKCILF